MVSLRDEMNVRNSAPGLLQDTGVERALSCDDQLFVYELAGQLIINSSLDESKKPDLMTTVLRPLVDNFSPLLSKMKEAAMHENCLPESQRLKGVSESEVYANTINYLISYAT